MVRFIVAACTLLTGCSLYFDHHDDSGSGDGHSLTIEISGSGAGVVYLEIEDTSSNTPPQTCVATCVVEVPDGDTARVTARTADVEAAWSPLCQGSVDPEVCDLGTVSDDVTLSTSFGLDGHELHSLSPGVPAAVGDFAPNGDIIVAGVQNGSSPSTLVSRVTTSGGVVWSVLIGSDPPLAVRAGASIAVATTTHIESLGGDGAHAWSYAFAIPVQQAALAFTSSGGVAVATGSSIFLLDSDGSVSWEKVLPTGQTAQSIAVDSSDNIAAVVATSTSPSSYAFQDTIYRFDPSGAPLPSWTLASQASSATIAFDSSGRLVVYQNTSLTAPPGLLTWLSSTGDVVSTASAPGQAPESEVGPGGPLPADVAIAANNAVVIAVPQFMPVAITTEYGATFAAFSADAIQSWMVSKTSDASEVPFDTYDLYDGVVLGGLGCSSAGICALFGSHQYWAPGQSSSDSWIELFEP